MSYDIKHYLKTRVMMIKLKKALSMKIICPNCTSVQPRSVLFCMGLDLFLKPRKWRCGDCGAKLSFTMKGIFIYWCVSFPFIFGFLVLLFKIIENSDIPKCEPLFFILTLSAILSVIPLVNFITRLLHDFKVRVVSLPRQ